MGPYLNRNIRNYIIICFTRYTVDLIGSLQTAQWKVGTSSIYSWVNPSLYNNLVRGLVATLNTWELDMLHSQVNHSSSWK
jgi:hypothetical protein